MVDNRHVLLPEGMSRGWNHETDGISLYTLTNNTKGHLLPYLDEIDKYLLTMVAEHSHIHNILNIKHYCVVLVIPNRWKILDPYWFNGDNYFSIYLGMTIYIYISMPIFPKNFSDIQLGQYQVNFRQLGLQQEETPVRCQRIIFVSIIFPTDDPMIFSFFPIIFSHHIKNIPKISHHIPNISHHIPKIFPSYSQQFQ